MTTGKTIALTRWTFVGKVMSLLFNVLFSLVIAFLPRSKHLLISAVTICSDFGAQKSLSIFIVSPKVDDFLELSCFLYDSVDVGNLISVPLPFLNPACTLGSSWFTYCWSLVWRILSITLHMKWVQWCGSLNILWHCPSLGLKWKLPFRVLWPLLSFPICWHPECSTLRAWLFRIWNSSARIPSSPLALFVVMLPKAHLTLHTGCLALGEWSHHCGYPGH